MSTPNKQTELWPLTRFRPHPKQRVYFGEPSDQEVQELAADMRRNGQHQPAEALPDGTLLVGHKRVKAAGLIGWDKIEVWVRHDLAAQPEAAERRLLEDNLYRRQLGPMGVARCYQAIRRLERKNASTRLTSNEKMDLRDRIAGRLGVSGRTLDRYLRVLDHTPPEVQDAVRGNKLALTLAEKVANLAAAEKAQVAQAIRDGGDPPKVVAGFVRRNADKAVRRPVQAFAALVRALERFQRDSQGWDRELPWLTPHDAKMLTFGRQVMEQVLSEHESATANATAVKHTDEQDKPTIAAGAAGQRVRTGRRGRKGGEKPVGVIQNPDAVGDDPESA
jgi:ParB-like chromosome segregation protein Spo0J